MVVCDGFIGNVVLRAWVGSVYEQRALPIFELLMLGQAIRMICNPYSTVLAATGQQRYAISGAIAEGVANLVFSLVGIALLGPIGVAWATLAGAIIGVIWMLLFTMRWARLIPINRKAFLWKTTLKPVLFYSPIIYYVIVSWHRSVSAVGVATCILYTVIIAAEQSRSRNGPVFGDRRITWDN